MSVSSHRVLYQDETLVAVDKPGGLLVHRTRESSDREFLLQQVRDQLGRLLYPVHRLDRPTSGVLVFAFGSEEARLLQEALSQPETRKEYLVLVRGSTPDQFESERPLTSKAGAPRPARSSFVKISELSRCTLLRARLHTGRRHQLRRHLAHCAHQVIGDTRYGKGRINRLFRERYGLPRLFLHAASLELSHPRSGAPLRIEAPLAADLLGFLERLPDADPELVRQVAGQS